MSIFGNIMSKIFGHAKAHEAPTPPQQPSSAPGTGGKTPGPAPAGPVTADTSSAKTAAAPAVAAQVDVEAVLKELASKNKEKLDWRHSIVDLMKLLKLDSSLSARKELAKELHYTGDTKNSAAMNIWLHKQVMIELAKNGGKVPNSLKT